MTTPSSHSRSTPERARLTASGSSTRKRTALVGVRLSPEEHAAICADALRLKTTPAALLRAAYLALSAFDAAQEAPRD